MLQHNTAMKEYLHKHGIECTPKRIDKGSLGGTWRLYNSKQKWSPALAEKLTELGFIDFDGRPLNQFSGNGGYFSVYVCGNPHLNN